MHRLFRGFRCAGLLLISILSLSPPTLAQTGTDYSIEEIVVSAKRQGPPLWKVSSGANSIWLFGILSPHPIENDWDSQSVRLIMSDSDVYIEPQSIKVRERNPFKLPGLIRKLNRFKKIPNDGSLEDILSPDLYNRFLAAKELYAPKNRKMVNMRPMFAAEELYRAALSSRGLQMNDHMASDLRRMARRSDVEIDAIVLRATGSQLSDLLENSNPPPNIACMEASLNSIETDLDEIVNRAESWRNGDASGFTQMNYPDVAGSCSLSHIARDQFSSSEWESTQSLWLQKVEEALSMNGQSFGSLPIRELVHPDGLLARLISKGYSVQIL